MGTCSARLRWEIAKTFAMRWKRHARPRAWAKATAHNRAQVLYYCAENLSQRRERDRSTASRRCRREASFCGSRSQASSESFLMRRGPTSLTARYTIRRFVISAIAMNEAIGTVGVICPSDTPLLGFLSLVMPLHCHGQYRHRGSVRKISVDHRRSLPAFRYQRSCPAA